MRTLKQKAAKPSAKLARKPATTARRARPRNLQTPPGKAKTPSHRVVSTAKEAIAALGGQKAVADWLGISEGSISGWLMNDEVAPSRALPVYLSLRAKGIECAPTVFGASSWDEEMVPDTTPQQRARAVAMHDPEVSLADLVRDVPASPLLIEAMEFFPEHRASVWLDSDVVDGTRAQRAVRALIMQSHDELRALAARTRAKPVNSWSDLVALAFLDECHHLVGFNADEDEECKQLRREILRIAKIDAKAIVLSKVHEGVGL